MKVRSIALEYMRHRNQMADLQAAGYPITREDVLYGATLERGLEDDNSKAKASTRATLSTDDDGARPGTDRELVHKDTPCIVLYSVTSVPAIPHPRSPCVPDPVSSGVDASR